jgi:AraC family transcriptional regulator of arabinose operon
MAGKMENLPILALNNAGADFRHDAQFRVDRPRGSGDYLFVHFTTPILIRDALGEREMPAETCILYAPGFPQWYYGPERGFANDWCHCTGAGVGGMVEQFGIAADRAVEPLIQQPFGELIRGMERELLRCEPHWQEACAGLLAQLLVAFARTTATVAQRSGTPYQAALSEGLRDVRSRVHKQLARTWSVPDMARIVHLSASRFAHVYRDFFGTGPMEDLIEARIAHACWLLSSGRVPVKQAAAESGFSDLHYFSRSFRARVGCAPREYCRRQLGEPAQPRSDLDD